MRALRTQLRMLPGTSLLAGAIFLAACSSAPQPRAIPPASLEAVNLALAQRFADVTLADKTVLHHLRGVRVSPEKLTWLNDQRQLRDLAIAQVVRIVAREKDPDAPPPTEGARLLSEPAPASADPLAASATNGTTIMGPVAPADGATGAVLAALYTTIGVASLESEEPGEIVYEGPVTRYLPAAPVSSPPPE